ncbi:MAG: carbamoyl-phosphate synthase large subunit, partial [Chitinophagales bacterium]
AKLAIGYSLDELKNQITGSTSAMFEPTLDYVIVKMPRWNFEKFPGAEKELGLQMKSVGEVMGIGRTFQEALQKACQSLEQGKDGLGASQKENLNVDKIVHGLENPGSDRIFLLKNALELGMPIQKLHEITKIDKWYLYELYDLVKTDNLIKKENLDTFSKEFMLEVKQKGYSDVQIAFLLGSVKEDAVYAKRKELGINRVYKMVDTCAAEFAAETPYYYSTFEYENESIVSEKKKIIVLGSG